MTYVHQWMFVHLPESLAEIYVAISGHVYNLWIFQMIAMNENGELQKSGDERAVRFCIVADPRVMRGSVPAL